MPRTTYDRPFPSADGEPWRTEVASELSDYASTFREAAEILDGTLNPGNASRLACRLVGTFADLIQRRHPLPAPKE
jgi:hypothetical protein